MLIPPAKILGGDKASLPQAGERSMRVFLVDRKAALGVRLQIERPSLAHQPVAKIDAGNGALSNPSFWVGGIGANIRTFDRPRRDELVQLFCSPDAAREWLAILVEARLITFQRIDAVKPEALAVDLNGLNIDGMCLASAGQNGSEEYKRGTSAAHDAIPPDHGTIDLLMGGHVLAASLGLSQSAVHYVEAKPEK